MFVQKRHDGGQRLVTSASDLTAASMCEFAFLRRVDMRLGREVGVPADDDPMRERAARLGDVHEARLLAAYVQEFGEGSTGTPGGVVDIGRVSAPSAEALLDAQDQTVAALRGGADVVFQATFFDPSQVAADQSAGERGVVNEPEIGFVGYADFLMRTSDGAYEVQDAKLARRAKVPALMQLAAYAEQLERLRVPVSREAVLILGDDSRSRHKLSDVAPVFRSRRARLHQLLLERARATGDRGRQETAAPIGWRAPGVVACGRCEVCEVEIQRTRDPLLIAGLRPTQRAALVTAGLDTIDKVAGALPRVASGSISVEGMTAPVVERLAWQAALQVEGEHASPPPFRVIDPAALAAIPKPDPGDLFFDFEGDPMFRGEREDGAPSWGLDYLFGMVDIHEKFTALWAHDLVEERLALVRFLAVVAERRSKYPLMHIYHYASYERTHLLSIAARHGIGEAEIDQLLRENVLVDLYPIVRRSVRVGSRSYSIKKLEPLYMGDELRDDGGVTNAAQSITEYADAAVLLASGAPDERAEGQVRLDAIADYNRYDCVSTLRLRDWLLALARERGVKPEVIQPASVGANESPSEPTFQLSRLTSALQMHAERAADPRDARLAALAASAIDYHEREQKAFWWAHYARLIDPIEDWASSRDVMVVDAQASVIEVDWFRLPRGRVDRREVRLSGEIAPGSTFRPGAQIFAVYDRPAPFAQRGSAPGARAARLVTVLEVHDDGVTIGETLPQDANGYHVLPVALTPGPPPDPGQQKPAILEWGQNLVDALDRGAVPLDAAVDILRRSKPRYLDGATGGATGDGEITGSADNAGQVDHVTQVTGRVLRLARSALPVQGPPGTGKTYLAAQVIIRLIREHGWSIGVVAQSHKVVENVLEAVVRAGLDPDLVAKAAPTQRRVIRATDAELDLPPAPKPPYRLLKKGEHSSYLDEHHISGCVVGGTAWDFSNTQKVARRGLDLLVIDEAGQFSLAPTIAASAAAERLLLLGDPQQLPQVSQGSHPEPINTSALGWLLGEHDTMPESSGYFLAETRRMRPELAEVISELAYEGRLRAHPDAALREVRGAGPAGLIWHPVSHRDNSTHSLEEAEQVVCIARRALKGRLSEPGQPGRSLTQEDLIVVAAYNAQVEIVSHALAVAGLGEVRVGTVDKFQGQEAVIAIVTLAASSTDDIPRDVEFLLMRNRLNVAISRAQWAAHLVSSDRLGDGLPASAEGVAALSGYLRLTERGDATAQRSDKPN